MPLSRLSDYIPAEDCLPTAENNINARAQTRLSSRSSSPSPTDFGSSSPADGGGSSRTSIPRTYNAYAPESCICRPDMWGDDGDDEGSADVPDEELLAAYRDDFAPLFPYVVLRAGTTAKTLATSSPFLWSVIKMVATSHRNLLSMRRQMYHIMRHVSEHMIMRSERSVDLLRGLVVLLGFYHFQCVAHAQLHNLLALAVSLACELGLNRAVFAADRGAKLFVINHNYVNPRTSDEKRLMCGVWYLSSV